VELYLLRLFIDNRLSSDNYFKKSAKFATKDSFQSDYTLTQRLLRYEWLSTRSATFHTTPLSRSVPGMSLQYEDETCTLWRRFRSCLIFFRI